jgi:transposase InsO family protein
MVEKESGKYIKVLRSNKRGDYMLTYFMEFCQSHRIKRQFTTHYTPQQNGVVERKNRTIMNTDQSMLKEKNLRNEYFGDGVICSIYIMNRSTTKIVKNQVSWEAWSGKNSNVSHLRIFGCVAYAHVHEEMRINLDGKSEKCVFVGYSEDTKTY